MNYRVIAPKTGKLILRFETSDQILKINLILFPKIQDRLNLRNKSAALWARRIKSNFIWANITHVSYNQIVDASKIHVKYTAESSVT